jgi:CO dehydrogenase maturation factor
LNGKGGTGKTTVASLFVKHLVSSRAGSVLAIDADPNSNMPESLGVLNAGTIVGVVEEISRNMDKIPAGVTKDRFIEMRVQESLSEEKGFDLLVMGRPEGPGCYCYVNNLLRDITSKITKDYDFIVIDNAAGMEHISRRTVRSIDKLILVSDHSIFGVRSAKRIYDLAKGLDLKIKESFLVVNKVVGGLDTISDEITMTGLKLAGSIPYDLEIQRLSLSAGTIFDSQDKIMSDSIENIISNIMKG